MMFYSYLWFAIASAAKSLCKTLISHTTPYTRQGLVAIAMHGCKKTKEVPPNRGHLLKSAHEKTHSGDTHRQTASSESLSLQISWMGKYSQQENGFSRETWSAGALGVIQHPRLTLESRREVAC